MIYDSLSIFPEDALLAQSLCSVGHMSLPSVFCGLFPQTQEAAIQKMLQRLEEKGEGCCEGPLDIAFRGWFSE